MRDSKYSDLVALARGISVPVLVVASVLLFAMRASYSPDANMSLTYLTHFEIEREAPGLSEPSGLALSHGRKALWTVSDDTRRVYALSLQGELQEDSSFQVPVKGLEGIAVDPGGEFLFMVKEEGNEIIKVDTGTQEIVDRKRLSEMAGYDAVAGYFQDSPPNKGLEGITWNTDRGSILVLKEGVPGLLVEVSADLAAIRGHDLLSKKNGFIDDDVAGKKLDFSGICYDQNRKHFWIVSDKAQRLFLYDRERNEVVQSFALGYGTKGEYQEIEKAEGIAIDPDSNRVFVVSDKEARLYVFDLHEEP